MKPGKKLLFLAMVTLPLGVHAKDNFVVRLILNPDSSSPQVDDKSFSSLDAALDYSESDSFSTIFPGPSADKKYTPTSAISAHATIQGLAATVSYTAESNNLVFSIPGLKINETFSCGGGGCTTRDASEEEFRTFLRENKDNIFGKIKLGIVAKSGSDPVSGNPNSLLYTMATDQLSSNMHSNIGKDAGKDEHKKEVGISYGHYSFDGNETNVVNIPASYTYYFDKPGYYAKFSGSPIAYIETNGSKAYKSSGTASLHIPVKDNWAVIPAAGIGGVGSEDLGSAAVVGSVSLTSLYETKMGKADIKIGNMLSTYKTSSVQLEDGEIDYDLSNHIVKNAISAKFPTKAKLMGKPLDMEATLADTRILGDDVYIDHYNDIAFSLGSAEKTGDSRLDDMRLGFTYTFGGTNKGFPTPEHPEGKTSDYNGFSINFGYSF